MIYFSSQVLASVILLLEHHLNTYRDFPKWPYWNMIPFVKKLLENPKRARNETCETADKYHITCDAFFADV